MPAKYPKPYYQGTAVAQGREGSRTDENFNPYQPIRQEITILWRHVKRLESQAVSLLDGSQVNFVDGFKDPITSVVLDNGTILYFTTEYEKMNRLFLEYLVHSTNLAPGLLGI
jgi:hypothetical protein